MRFDYFNKWKIELNLAKMEYMVCSRKRTTFDGLNNQRYGEDGSNKVDQIKILQDTPT